MAWHKLTYHENKHEDKDHEVEVDVPKDPGYSDSEVFSWTTPEFPT